MSEEEEVEVRAERQFIDSVLSDNRHWKKHIIGKGNCNKTSIKEFTVDKWGDIFSEQDWCDASCIALWIKRRIIFLINLLRLMI